MTRSAVGVLALKNFSQFAVISATAAELVVAEPDAADAAGAAAVVEAAGAGADEEAAELDELELQAATAAMSVTARAGASMIRRAASGSRMTRPLSRSQGAPGRRPGRPRR
jgi:hypothetical protein